MTMFLRQSWQDPRLAFKNTTPLTFDYIKVFDHSVSITRVLTTLAAVTLLWRTLVILMYAVVLRDQSSYNVIGSPCIWTIIPQYHTVGQNNQHMPV